MTHLKRADVQSGLHSEVCDIDYKLHAIIGSRKRCVIQQIQEETATNIYYPTSLVGVLNTPQPGSQQGVGYRNMGMGPMSMQPTGQSMGMQMTGQGMPGMHMGGMMGNMNQPSHMGGMGMGMNNGFQPHPHQPPHHHPHQRNNHAPAYNPHQHVHYPYQPQPLDINPQTTRGLPYNGPGMQHYNHGPMNQGPMSMNHTGMSQIPSGYSTRGMSSPMPMAMSPPPHQGHPNHHGGPNMHMPLGGMPYGQNHMHVGLGGGPMGINMGGGMMNMQPGMVMGMGPGQFGAGPHPGLSVHGGEQGVLGKSNQIWITGEFFGVQRARDMLLNVAVQKARF